MTRPLHDGSSPQDFSSEARHLPVSHHEAFSKELRARVRPDQYDTWFGNVRVLAAGDKELLLSVPNIFVRDWISRHYMGVLARAAEAARPGSKPKVRLVLVAPNTAPQPVRPPAAGPASVALEPQPAVTKEVRPSNAGGHFEPSPPHQPRSQVAPDLNPHYTFEEFVVGDSNRLAQAAAMAIGESPGRSYNPFFVHGAVGLGKTHLMQSICHAILGRQPDAKVVYVSCEEFTNGFIDALQGRRLTEFRARYRSADVLVMDDIEFLTKKKQTQEEFVHTFNALYNRQSQIVLSSDCHAPEIPLLDDRLVSRFKCGLEAAITAPCFETRAAIVRRKAKMREVDLPDDVVSLIAESISSNVRELEGAITKILGMAAISATEIDMPLVERALRGRAVPHSRKASVPDIMNLVSREFCISTKDLVGRSRTHTICEPRQIAMYLVRTMTKHSLQDIGRTFGRDHTTVMYSVRKVGKRAKRDRMFQDFLASLNDRLTPAG